MQRDLMEGYATVWVFTGAGARTWYPSGVFSTREKAEEWIAQHGLSGTLTQYPLDTGSYDWAVKEGAFRPMRPDQATPEFIQGFASGYRHFHYERGREPGV
jgi:hypothetical protein